MGFRLHVVIEALEDMGLQVLYLFLFWSINFLQENKRWVDTFQNKVYALFVIVVLEDMGLQVAPQQGTHDYHKYLNTSTQYEMQIVYLRKLLNHTFLRVVNHDTSTRQARMEYKEVQEACLHKNVRRTANNIKLFAAQNIID